MLDMIFYKKKTVKYSCWKQKKELEQPRLQVLYRYQRGIADPRVLTLLTLCSLPLKDVKIIWWQCKCCVISKKRWEAWNCIWKITHISQEQKWSLNSALCYTTVEGSDWWIIATYGHKWTPVTVNGNDS